MTYFDLSQLWRSIDEERQARGMTWASLSEEVGVGVSTIRRFSEASDAEADGVLALVGWLGVAPECFIAESSVDGSPLPESGGGMIRVDMGAIAQLTHGEVVAQGRTRTTIQRLVGAAQASGRTVASLTRWSAD